MNYVRILGASGSKTKTEGTTCFQIYKDILVDAGNVLNILGEDSLKIKHIFLTHSHSDHISDLPFIIESYFEKRTSSLNIYASKQTLDSLREFTFNNQIWPDFTKINLFNSNKKALIFNEIKENESINLHSYNITAIEANHISGSLGFEITKKDSFTYIISGDTYINESLAKRIDNNKKINTLFIECSFSNKMEELAYETKHLTPKLLKKQLSLSKRNNFQIFINHLKPPYEKEIKKQIKELNIFKYGGKILEEQDIIHINTKKIETKAICYDNFEKIMDISLKLSTQYDINKLFEMILTLTRQVTKSEAGTLYILDKKKLLLNFKIIQNEKLNINLINNKNDLKWQPLKLYFDDNKKNNEMIATTCALENKIIIIDNVYSNTNYDFSGTKKFDKKTGYISKSMIVVPLVNHENDVIGVLQLINKKDPLSSKITTFNSYDERIIKALASQIAMALTNLYLINSLESFLDSFVLTIAKAIDAKSKHTSNHISNVEQLALSIADAIHKDTNRYKDIKYSENDFKQIKLAAWMHDIGKISIPESIIDKATKLQTNIDRIKGIEERVEIIKRDYKILFLENKISLEQLENKNNQLEEDLNFLREVNIGSEFMDKNKIKKIHEISKHTYTKDSKKTSILSDDEKYNLLIEKGTLNNEEKYIMNSHAKLSYDMLKHLIFPKKYKNVLNIAANHHEKLNGKGYPRGLKEEDISLEDRIMILSDIFEALTSHDRPYKEGKKLSEVFKILDKMAENNEIDINLLNFFKHSEVLEKYKKNKLLPYQIDI